MENTSHVPSHQPDKNDGQFLCLIFHICKTIWVSHGYNMMQYGYNAGILLCGKSPCFVTRVLSTIAIEEIVACPR